MTELDWEAMARRAVVDTLQVVKGERVVTLGDSVAFAGLHEALNYEVLKAGGIVHAHLPAWRGRTMELRTTFGTHPDADSAAAEVRALGDLLASADVFAWLPHSFCPVTITGGASETVLSTWQGRGLHFHFFDEWHLPADHPVQARLQQTLQSAVLDLDYDEHRAVQHRLLAAVRGRELHVTSPDGTDVRVALEQQGWYHLNDGVVSPEKRKTATCARDREEELPCGSVRTIPVLDSATGVLRYRRPGRSFGAFGHDVSRFCAHLDLHLERGRIVRVDAGPLQAEWDAFWAGNTGAFDRVTEVVFGTNPLLADDDELVLPPYWGFGAGMFRLHTGSNLESGGDLGASLSMELFQWDATVTADGTTVVDAGRLVV